MKIEKRQRDRESGDEKIYWIIGYCLKRLHANVLKISLRSDDNFEFGIDSLVIEFQNDLRAKDSMFIQN